jgi:hypothetical protein
MRWNGTNNATTNGDTKVASNNGNGGKPKKAAEVRRIGGKITSKSGNLRHGRHADLTDDRLPKTADPKKSKRIGRPPGSHRKGT